MKNNAVHCEKKNQISEFSSSNSKNILASPDEEFVRGH